MRHVLIVATAVTVFAVSPAAAQLVGQPSGQGGAPPPPPNVSTAPPTVQGTPSTLQNQDTITLQQLEGSASESQTGSGSPYTPSPRVRALNQLTRPAIGGDRGQADRPAGPLR
jgi:hypothetical protein